MTFKRLVWCTFSLILYITVCEDEVVRISQMGACEVQTCLPRVSLVHQVKSNTRVLSLVVRTDVISIGRHIQRG